MRSFFAFTILTASLAMGTAGFAQSTSATASGGNMCGPNNVRCMEGYTPTCSGSHWLCSADHPSSSSSSSSSSSVTSTPVQCPALYILCITGATASCDDGHWRCNPDATGQSVTITNLSPASGTTGARVIITGTGFLRAKNTVHFADSVIPNVRSRDGKRIVLTVPAQTSRPCPVKGTLCKLAIRLYTPGTYDVYVENKNGTSATETFTVTAKRTSSASSL